MLEICRGPVGRARLVFAAVLVAGMLVGGGAFAEFRRIEAPLGFEPTPCTMEECRFAGDKAVRGGHSVTLFTPAVKYRYQVDGVAYRGDTTAARPVPIAGEFARQSYESKYAPGESATCFRDPRNPAASVLSQESDRGELDYRAGVAAVALGLAAAGWGSLEYFSKPRNIRTRTVRGGHAGLPDDVPENDLLSRTRAMVRDRERGYRQ